MKVVLCPQTSYITPVHSEACMKLKLTKYTPDIEKLTKEKQGQGSHELINPFMPHVPLLEW
jgi:hypothetical protein